MAQSQGRSRSKKVKAGQDGQARPAFIRRD
jgi:hypothetical protein